MFRFVWVAAIVAVGPLAHLHAEGPTLLRYRYTAGETLRYNLVQKAKIRIETDSRTFEFATEQTNDIVRKTVSVGKDGVALATQTTERIRFSSSGGPAGEYRFDSQTSKPDSQDGTGIDELFRALVGAEFQFRVDATGAISDVKVPRSLVEKLAKVNRKPLPEHFSEAGLKRLLAQGSLVLSPQPVAAGGVWSNDPLEVAEEGVVLTTTTVNTYRGAEAGASGRDRIDRTSTTALRMAPDPPPGLNVKIVSQEGSAAAYFDNVRGRLAESSGVQKMTLDVDQNGRVIHRTTETATTLKLQP